VVKGKQTTDQSHRLE